MRFKQVRHLMQNAEAHIIVWLNRFVALSDRISERFKVHTELRRFDLHRRLDEVETGRELLLRIQDCL